MPLEITIAGIAKNISVRGRKHYHCIPKVIDFDNLDKQRYSTEKPCAIEAVSIVSKISDGDIDSTRFNSSLRILTYKFKINDPDMHDYEICFHVSGMHEIVAGGATSARERRVYIRGSRHQKIDLISYDKYTPEEFNDSIPDISEIDIGEE